MAETYFKYTTMDKTLEQLKNLTEQARLDGTDDEFVFYKSQQEKYVTEKFFKNN